MFHFGHSYVPLPRLHRHVSTKERLDQRQKTQGQLFACIFINPAWWFRDECGWRPNKNRGYRRLLPQTVSRCAFIGSRICFLCGDQRYRPIVRNSSVPWKNALDSSPCHIRGRKSRHVAFRKPYG